MEKEILKVITPEGDIIDQHTGLLIVNCLKCGAEYRVDKTCECEKEA